MNPRLSPEAVALIRQLAMELDESQILELIRSKPAVGEEVMIVHRVHNRGNVFHIPVMRGKDLVYVIPRYARDQRRALELRRRRKRR